MDRGTVKILVVDDHEENLVALRAMLLQHECEVIEATSGAQALKRVLGHDLALILLDVVMPHMDGFETARLVRAREASRHIPIIFLTASGDDIDAIYRGYSVGAVDYLVKPIDPDILKAKVSVFVDLYKKGQRIRVQEGQLREAERLRSETALRDSETLYEATFDAAAIGIAHTDTDGRWLRVNQKLCDITGYTKDELLCLRCQDITHPDDVADTVAAMHMMLAGEQETYRLEKRYERKNGGVVWVNLTASLLLDPTGKPKHFIKIIEDVSELRFARAREQFLAEASECLLSSLDYRETLSRVARLAVPALADWCVIDIALNPAAPEELAAVHVEPEKTDQLQALRRRLPCERHYGVPKVLQNGRCELITIASDAELARLSPDEGTLALWHSVGFKSLMIVPFMARDHVLGTFTFVLGKTERRYTMADMTMAEDLARRTASAIENAQLYRQVQDAVRARDEFLHIASHELRTPLTPLQINFRRLLGERSKEPLEKQPIEKVRATLTRCEKQLLRLGALVEKLLDVTRISSGHFQLELQNLDLVELTRDVIGRFGEEASRAKCALSLDAPSAVNGRWDRLRLEQVVTNLLANAIKYGAGTPIEVVITEENAMASIRVRDQGIGIAADDIPRLFERFERAASWRSYGGLGLGLYIVRQIVQAHGGTIHVSSAVGVGSMFLVTLPIDATATLDSEAATRLEGWSHHRSTNEREVHAR